MSRSRDSSIPGSNWKDSFNDDPLVADAMAQMSVNTQKRENSAPSRTSATIIREGNDRSLSPRSRPSQEPALDSSKGKEKAVQNEADPVMKKARQSLALLQVLDAKTFRDMTAGSAYFSRIQDLYDDATGNNHRLNALGQIIPCTRPITMRPGKVYYDPPSQANYSLVYMRKSTVKEFWRCYQFETRVEIVDKLNALHAQDEKFMARYRNAAKDEALFHELKQVAWAVAIYRDDVKEIGEIRELKEGERWAMKISTEQVPLSMANYPVLPVFLSPRRWLQDVMRSYTLEEAMNGVINAARFNVNAKGFKSCEESRATKPRKKKAEAGEPTQEDASTLEDSEWAA